MTVRCKMRCSGIETHPYGDKTFRFHTEYDGSIPEDIRFSKATPVGHFEFRTSGGCDVADQFEPGKSYYFDIKEAA